MTNCKLIKPSGDLKDICSHFDSPLEAYKSLWTIKEAYNLCKEHGIVALSESDYPFLPFISSCDETITNTVTAPNGMSCAIGIIKQLKIEENEVFHIDSSIDINDGTYADGQDYLSDEDIDVQRILIIKRIRKMFKDVSGNELKGFVCGGMVVNPVPVFLICKLSSTIIGGFITGFIWT